jgi:hypothetical protein
MRGVGVRVGSGVGLCVGVSVEVSVGTTDEVGLAEGEGVTTAVEINTGVAVASSAVWVGKAAVFGLQPCTINAMIITKPRLIFLIFL